jgi:Tfp pilus assembly protein PilN
MIQFNLLPDVKMKYVKAKRTKKLIISTSILVSVASVFIVVVLFGVVQVGQKKHINDLTADIKSETSKIRSTENLDEILTVQNQLTLLTDLHEKKPQTSRLFDYITFVSPVGIKVLTLNFDAESELIIIQGSADKISTVNTLVDNIKATKFSAGNSESDENDVDLVMAFTQVSTQLNGDNDKATYKVQMNYDPIIFDNTKDIVMQLDSQTFSTKDLEGGQQ